MNSAHRLFIIIIFIFLVLFIMGNILGRPCSEIGSCKACWNVIPTEVSSDLCPRPNETCIADPIHMQHNAMVDLVICGCTEAESVGYSDTELNNQIKDTVRSVFGYDLSLEQICSSPGLLSFMTKIKYG